MLMATKQQQQQHGPATLRLLLGKTRLFSWLHHRSLPAARTQPPIHLAQLAVVRVSAANGHIRIGLAPPPPLKP